MARFRKKPVVIEAIQYDGTFEGFKEVREFVGNDLCVVSPDGDLPTIRTLEGDMLVSKDDFVIRGVKGECYPCKPDIFAATYEPEGASVCPATFDFGQALRFLKAGRRLRRRNWNGKGMFIYHMPGYLDGISATPPTAKALGIPMGEIVRTRPYLAMKDAQDMIVTGWLASQTDLLAEDWELAE